MRRFAGAHLMAKPRAKKTISKDQSRVCREDQVGQTRLRGHPLDLDAEAMERVLQPLPLMPSAFNDDAASPAHPRVDLVLDAVVIGRTHQDARRLHDPSGAYES